jgi:hypothetical protein
MTSRKKLRKISGVNWVRWRWIKGIHKLKRVAFYNVTQRKLNKTTKI